MPDVSLSVTLEEIRERHGAFVRHGGALLTRSEARNAAALSAADVPFLLAALDAVLKQAVEWEAEAWRLDGLADREADPQSRIAVSLRAQAYEDCAAKVREAITRELTGNATSR